MGTATAGEPAKALLEALRHALGARSVWLEPRDAPRPESFKAGGVLRRGEVHHLTVDVPSSSRRLVCALGRLPTEEDTLLAGAVASALEPPATRRPGPPSVRLRTALASLSAPVERRTEAVLDTAVQLAGAPAGALALTGDRGTIVRGTGKAALRRAASEAMGGADGRIEQAGRSFLAVPLVWYGTTVGGLALEDSADTPEIRAYANLAAAVLRPPEPPPPPTGREGLEDLRAALATIPLAAIAVDTEGNLLGASPEAERMFGLVADFDLGLPVLGRLRSEALEAIVLGAPVDERLLEVGDGTYEPAAVPLPGGGRVVTLHDRTQQETLERLQEDLVASVAHELRTPIAAVKGLVQLMQLRAGKLEPDKLAALLADGAAEIARLERLVEDLLLAARVATGGIVAQPDAIDLRPIAEDVVSHALPRYGDRRFEITGEAEAYADPSLVRHAIWHLVDNAAKFGPRDGRVRITIADGAEGPEVHVSDEGEGIFSGDIPNLFKRFRQLDPSATRQHGGSGLGLFLVKSIVDAHDGRVWVESRLGRGSTFSVRLQPVPDDV